MTTISLAQVLVPRRRSGVVSRRRLLDFLHRHLERRLQLVIAPAGYGKTTLLVDFAHEAREQGVPVCWLTLTEADTDPRTFLEHVLLSLRRQFPDFGGRTAQLLAGVDDAAREHRAITLSLANEIAETIQDFFVIVVDDYHVVQNLAAVNEALNGLLERLPDGCRIILSGRTIPTKLDLVHLAARLDVAGLGTADLRFRAEEAAQLIAAQDTVAVHPREAERVVARAEGWVTAIVLSLHARERSRFAGLLQAKSQGQEVYDYLASQVFTRLPAAQQEFLLESAVLPVLSAEDCDRLLHRQDSAAQLAGLVQAGLFIEPLEAPTPTASNDGGSPALVFRYHQLWREFLLWRFERQNPAALAALQQRASAAALQRGDTREALNFLFAAGDWSRAARLLLRIAETELSTGHAERFLSWVERVPEPVRERWPLLLVHGARALRRRDRLRDALAWTETAERLAVARRDWPTAYLARAWKAEMLAFSGQVEDALRVISDLLDFSKKQPPKPAILVQLEKEAFITLAAAGRFREAAQRGQRVLELLPHVRSARERRHLAAIVHHGLAVCERRAGNVDAAIRHCQEAATLWQALGNVTQLSRVLTLLGLTLRTAGRLDEAVERYGEALELAEALGLITPQVEVLINLAECERLRGRPATAKEAIERGLPLARQLDEPRLLCEALHEAGRIALAMGATGEAVHLLESAGEVAESAWPAGRPLAKACVALAYARQGQRGAALAAMQAARRGLGEIRGAEEHIAAEVALTAAAAAAGRPDEAMVLLRAGRRWARDHQAIDFFLRECAQYGETAQLLLGQRRANLSAETRLALQTAAAQLRPRLIVPREAPRLRAVEPAMPAVEFEIVLFGVPYLLRDGTPVAAGRTTFARELLYYLAIRAESLVRSETIIDVLLPDVDFERGLTALRQGVYQLRRAFAPLDAIRSHRGGYQLALGQSIHCDVVEFERLLNRARAVRGAAQAELLEMALRRYRGPLLEGVDSEWVAGPRAEMERRFLAAADTLLAHFEMNGRHQAAVELAARVVALDPYQEQFHLALLRHQVALGQVAAARRHYAYYDQLMRQELGQEPAPEAARLVHASAAGPTP